MSVCKRARGRSSPKMKTKKSASKRFSLTSSGLVKHVATGRRHGLSNKSRKRKRQLLRAHYLSGKHARNAKKLICFK